MSKAPRTTEREWLERKAASQERRPRESEQQSAYEYRDEWANSPGLQPPK
jgi:hypothetical protein